MGASLQFGGGIVFKGKSLVNSGVLYQVTTGLGGGTASPITKNPGEDFMKHWRLFLPVFGFLISCGTSTPEIDVNLNSDGDCMTDVVELELGTDPYLADSDGDGVSDCAELDCVSDPLDGNEQCYACGWKHNDPDRLVSGGSGIGDIIDNRSLPDQCGDSVALWDLYGEYHIMYLTAAW